ncbi:hypothetical protein J5226_19805 [Lysobacter sp. K5869]|uniref:hypothetical protein n=1 Tax=Lysobacter sp. K5869 TaxID=2820808 RepID=UPI001C0631CA|nr:hypothetical protein [Lysobacter sp. K5869]QWP75831.1 hypothetical protein J5226_19805 [Lysobacter sp. K5869]
MSTRRAIAASLGRIVLAAAKVLAATGLCVLGLWAWMAFAPVCRFDQVEWMRYGRRVPDGEVCVRDVDVRRIELDGRDCLELFALKDGLPIGEHCPAPGAR